MKIQILAIAIIILSSCKSNKLDKSEKMNYINNTESINYIIYKIDSINSFYLIYAKNGEELYKIVSKKTNLYNCDKIKLNSNYQLKLRAMGVLKPAVGDEKTRPMNYLDFADPCRKFDDSTKICIERYMKDLYFADNVKGLCLDKLGNPPPR